MDGAGARGWRGWSRLRVVVFFLLGLALVDYAVRSHAALWLRYDSEVYRKRLAACRQRPHDVVILGSSPTMCGIDPDALLGLAWRGKPVEDAFNAGLPLATAAEVWHVVEHGLPVPPRLLVYGITATDLNEDRVEPQGPRTLMDAGDVAAWVRARPEAASWCLRHFASERVARAWQLYYHSEGIRLWAADRAERLRPGLCPELAAEARSRAGYNERLSRGGFLTAAATPAGRLDCRKAAGSIGPEFPFLDNYRIGTYLAYLHRLIDWAAARGVPLVLLDLPVSADLEERMRPGCFARYHEALAQVERSRGVRVLRATRAATGIGDADFSDWVHLNSSGAERLSRWLRHELAAIDGAGRAD
jgi:hypothetical protein